MPREIDEAFVEEAIEHYRRIEALQEEFEKKIADIEVTVRSPDGLVEIVVTGSGEFRDVAISSDRNGRDLATSVLAACQAASQAREWAQDKLFEEHFRSYRSLRTRRPGERSR